MDTNHESTLITAAIQPEASTSSSLPTPPPATSAVVNDEDSSRQLPIHESTSGAADVTSEAKLSVQPASEQPDTQPEAGISSVAQFLPSDAQVNHSTPPPSQPLATDEHDPAVDATTSDSAQVPTLAPLVPDVPGTEAAPGAIAPVEPSHATALTSEAEVAVPSTDNTIAPPAPDVPVASTEVANDTPLDVKSEVKNADAEMTDVAASGVVRPREDDALADEPSAKRARTEDAAPSQVAEFKRPEVSEAAPTTAPVSAAPPATSAVPTVNGASSHLPARRSYTSQPMGPAQKKALEEKVKNTKKIKNAMGFLRPVDYATLNIPTYPEIIKQPMDLGTMETKLKHDQYASQEDFVKDFDLMVNNCFTFNGPAHPISVAAQNLRAYFLKQMDSVPSPDAVLAAHKAAPVKKMTTPPIKPPPAPRRESRASTGAGAARSPSNVNDTFALLPGGTPQIRRDSTAGRPKRAIVPPTRDLPSSNVKPKRKEAQTGLKFCEHLLDELRKPKNDSATIYFRDPVDPVALNIPNYFSIIRQPMDIRSMTTKLKTGEYSTADEFRADFDLMIANCRKFNPEGNLVRDMGEQLKVIFDDMWKEKNAWIKKNQPQSQRVSPASDVESDAAVSDEEEEGGDPSKDTTIAQLQEQLLTMQNMLSGLTQGGKRMSPKAAGTKKKSRTSGGSGVASKPKKGSTAGAPRAAPASKAKPKKQRPVTYDEKQEISNATEKMSEEQITKLTSIITDNVAKYKDMAGDDVELEIDDLPDAVQRMLLKYVRSIFGNPNRAISPPDDGAIDDEYEPGERGGNAAKGGAGGSRKKHKPMKRHEQESRIAQLKASMAQLQGGVAEQVGTLPSGGGGGGGGRQESSDEGDSESSEEE